MRNPVVNDMTARTLPEWIGASPDTPFPPRVRLRILLRQNGRCALCPAKIVGSFVCDHVVALVNGGENRESNGQAICRACDKVKTAGDVAEKAKTASMAKAAHGLKRPKAVIPGSRASGWKHKINGSWERRT